MFSLEKCVISEVNNTFYYNRYVHQHMLNLIDEFNNRYNGYSVPFNILWDGIHSKPEAIVKEDLFVFTLSIYNTNEMPVYSVSEVGVKGRSYWHDRRTKAVKLDLIGFMDRIKFCNKFSRKFKLAN